MIIHATANLKTKINTHSVSAIVVLFCYAARLLVMIYGKIARNILKIIIFPLRIATKIELIVQKMLNIKLIYHYNPKTSIANIGGYLNKIKRIVIYNLVVTNQAPSHKLEFPEYQKPEG